MDMRFFFSSSKKKGQHMANLAVERQRDEEKEELDFFSFFAIILWVAVAVCMRPPLSK